MDALALGPLGDGKHTELTVSVTGCSRNLRRVTKRLLFFELVDAGGRSFECIAKDRDGYLTAEDIGALGAALAEAVSWQVELDAFPEVACESLVLHLKRVELLPGACGGLELAGRRRFPAAADGSSEEIAAPPVPLTLPEARYVNRVPWKKSANRVRPNKETRHQQFVEFLIETHGIERLRSGAGVLDVAGGAGGVAFELAFRWRIPCTVVDPRPLKWAAATHLSHSPTPPTYAVHLRRMLTPHAPPQPTTRDRLAPTWQVLLETAAGPQ